MESKHGIWKISKGKGDRVYINCIAETKIIHPAEICKSNGMGIYYYDNLKDLAIAILKYEQEKFKTESIMRNFEEDFYQECKVFGIQSTLSDYLNK